MSSVEIYGFVGWISSFVIYGLYLLWALVPDHILQAYGFTYFPSKHWSLAFPCVFVMTFIFIWIMILAFNMINTKPATSHFTM